jgi:hypothetical protein
MAYHLHHYSEFFNCLNEKIRVELYKKDVIPDDVTELIANAFTVQYPNGTGDKFDPIIISEAKLSLTLYTEDNITFEDLIVTYPDEWKMIAYSDSQPIFIGFLTPGEGRADFQDKPYDLTLSAVDGIGLLKGTPLTQDNGEAFTGVNLIIDYVIAILNKTGLELNLRLFSNITEQSMQDRTQNQNADTFNQTGLHARTFLKNAVEFYDCYTCLERLLSEYFSLYQWNGKWVILRIGELQESVGAKMWYTDYNTSGAVISSAQYLEDPAANGRDRLIHPVEISQFISSNFAVKFSKYTFNYSVWPELPTNNKFIRGTQYETGVATDDFDSDGDGDTSEVVGTYYKYTIDNWEQGIIDYFDLPHPAMVPTTKKFWRETYVNQFGVEIENYIKSDTDDNDSTHAFWLRSEGIPVYRGDKVGISLSKRFFDDFSSSSSSVFTAAANVYLVAGSSAWVLTNNTSGLDTGKAIWRKATANLGNSLNITYAANQQTNTFASLSVTSEPIPADGTLYIAFDSDGPTSNTGPHQYIKDFNFTYYPFILGGYLPLKGDFAMTSQNATLKDVIEEDVYISDSPKKVFQGALYQGNLTDLTTPTWKRYGVNEQRHFKEIGELARYNNNYRRMWKMDGQYDGLKFTPAGNQTIIEPLSFHRQFAFPDSSLLNGHYFVLVPPLTINYSEGRANMNFVEVLQDGAGDGNNLGDSHIPIQYIFE